MRGGRREQQSKLLRRDGKSEKNIVFSIPPIDGEDRLRRLLTYSPLFLSLSLSLSLFPHSLPKQASPSERRSSTRSSSCAATWTCLLGKG